MKLTESELFLDEREAGGIEAREQTISSNVLLSEMSNCAVSSF